VSGGGGTFAASYYVYDPHGTIVALTDQTGTVTDTYEYDAWGVLLSAVGTTTNHYRYAGEQYDADLGLSYNRARFPRLINCRIVPIGASCHARSCR
jgi:YD repeat-containing protein